MTNINTIVNELHMIIEEANGTDASTLYTVEELLEASIYQAASNKGYFVDISDPGAIAAISLALFVDEKILEYSDRIGGYIGEAIAMLTSDSNIKSGWYTDCLAREVIFENIIDAAANGNTEIYRLLHGLLENNCTTGKIYQILDTFAKSKGEHYDEIMSFFEAYFGESYAIIKG